jgi:hypothetical protein
MNLFDTVVKPILLYGSEIWGMDFVNKKDTNKLVFPKLDSVHPCERVHIRTCKHILRVPRSASNCAVLAELGRFPLSIEIMKSMAKFYCRLEGMKDRGILNTVYQTSKLDFNRLESVISYIKQEINCTSLIVDFKSNVQVNAFIKNFLP